MTTELNKEDRKAMHAGIREYIEKSGDNPEILEELENIITPKLLKHKI